MACIYVILPAYTHRIFFEQLTDTRRIEVVVAFAELLSAERCFGNQSSAHQQNLFG
jgi:hypothetical protein